MSSNVQTIACHPQAHSGAVIGVPLATAKRCEEGLRLHQELLTACVRPTRDDLEELIRWNEDMQGTRASLVEHVIDCAFCFKNPHLLKCTTSPVKQWLLSLIPRDLYVMFFF